MRCGNEQTDYDVLLCHTRVKDRNISNQNAVGFFFFSPCLFSIHTKRPGCLMHSQTEFTDAAHARLCSFNVCFQCQTHRNLKRSRATFFSLKLMKATLKLLSLFIVGHMAQWRQCWSFGLDIIAHWICWHFLQLISRIYIFGPDKNGSTQVEDGHFGFVAAVFTFTYSVKRSHINQPFFLHVHLTDFLSLSLW